MIQIPDVTPDGPREEINLQIEDPDLDFEKAKETAKQRSRELRGETMLLSWHNALTGEYYPTHECGGNDRPPWIVYAESRGANLTIRINNGAYTFMFLKLSG